MEQQGCYVCLDDSGGSHAILLVKEASISAGKKADALFELMDRSEEVAGGFTLPPGEGRFQVKEGWVSLLSEGTSMGSWPIGTEWAQVAKETGWVTFGIVYDSEPLPETLPKAADVEALYEERSVDIVRIQAGA
jgi:hypothetical protein